MRFFSDNAAAACPEAMAAIVAANRLDTAYDGDAWSARLDDAFSELFETRVTALVGGDRHGGERAGARRALPALRKHRLPPRRAYPE